MTIEENGQHVKLGRSEWWAAIAAILGPIGAVSVVLFGLYSSLKDEMLKVELNQASILHHEEQLIQGETDLRETLKDISNELRRIK